MYIKYWGGRGWRSYDIVAPLVNSFKKGLRWNVSFNCQSTIKCLQNYKLAVFRVRKDYKGDCVASAAHTPTLGWRSSSQLMAQLLPQLQSSLALTNSTTLGLSTVTRLDVLVSTCRTSRLYILKWNINCFNTILPILQNWRPVFQLSSWQILRLSKL